MNFSYQLLRFFCARDGHPMHSTWWSGQQEVESCRCGKLVRI